MGQSHLRATIGIRLGVTAKPDVDGLACLGPGQLPVAGLSLPLGRQLFAGSVLILVSNRYFKVVRAMLYLFGQKPAP